MTKNKHEVGGVSPKILEKIVCPLTKASLSYNKKTGELICKEAGLAYPIDDDIPIMLIDHARKIND